MTLVRRRDVPLDGTAPALLYGYGAYEACDDPAWDPALPSLLDGGGTNTSQGNPPNERAVAGSSNRDGGENQGSQGDGGGGGAVANTPEPTTQTAANPEETPAPSDNQPGEDGQQEQGGLTAEAAEETVRNVYETAESENYEASYNLLSDGFKTTTLPVASAGAIFQIAIISG